MGSPSGPRSGRHGYANGIPFNRNWSLNWNRALERRYHSASASGPETFLGVEDWNGVIEGFGGNPGVFPGEAITLKLFAGPDTGTYGDTGVVYEGTAICDSLTITWTFQPSASIGYSLAFSADGCLTDNTGEYYDTTNECESNVCNLLIQSAGICNIETGTGTGTGTVGAPSYSEVSNVESAVLTITANNQPIVNSSTNCCTERDPGTLDWTLGIVDQEQYPLFEFLEYYAFRLYNKGSEYWELSYLELADVSDIRTDIESGAITTKTNNFMGSARICCNPEDGPQLGAIIDPDGDTKWPVLAS